MRIPESLYAQVYSLIEAHGYRLPLYSSRVPAGTPGLADEHVEERLDLNTLLVKRPADTFLLRVSGDSMTGVGIFGGDLLIVDRQEPPRNGRVVVANVNGKPTVKTFRRDRAGKITLLPANEAYAPIAVAHDDDLVVLGSVVGVVKRFA